MKKKGASVEGIILLVVLVGALAVSSYLLYLNLPGEPQEFTFIDDESDENVVYGTSQQFYENMRFPDKKITYNFKDECSGEKIVNAGEAFSVLEEKTILKFEKTSNNPQIIIFCSDISPEPEEKGYFIAGEGGPTEVINTTLYGAILSGKLSLFRDETCNKPHIATHEILHVLGFEHNNNPESILYPTLDCDQEIDSYIIEDINNLYSVEGKADFKIINVNAVKSGRYLSFDIEIINRGLSNAENLVLSVYADGEFVKDFEMDAVGIGIKKTLHVENLAISRFADEVSFVLDEQNIIPEIFEDNNEIELILEED